MTVQSLGSGPPPAGKKQLVLPDEEKSEEIYNNGPR